MSESKVDATPAVAVDLQKPQLLMHNFSAKLLEQFIHFQIIFMKGSLFIWIGEQLPKTHDLSVSLVSNMDSVPSLSTLMGDHESPGNSISQRIAKQYQVVTFVSYNAPNSQRYLDALVEKRLVRELKSCQEKGLFQPTAVKSA